MSARRHPNRRAARRSPLHPRRPTEVRREHDEYEMPGGVATVAGWFCGPENEAEARKRTHDILVELTGEKRTGGVHWLLSTGDAALSNLQRLQHATGRSADPQIVEHYQQIRSHLRQFGGHLVIAYAEAAGMEATGS